MTAPSASHPQAATALPEIDLTALADPETWRGWLATARVRLEAELASFDVAMQLATIGAAIAIAWAIATFVAPRLATAFERGGAQRLVPHLRQHLALIAPPLLVLVALIAAHAALEAGERPVYLVRTALSLASVWLIIRIATHFIRDPFWSGAAAFAVWTGALLNIFGLLGPTVAALDAVGFSVAGARVSVWTLMRAVVVVTVLLTFASWLSAALRRRIEATRELEPSLQILFGSTIQVTLIAAAILMGLGSVGVPLEAFAIFGGAVGLGLGFGLQKIVSNFISGIILLLDRSIKPGDVIEVTGSYGWVNSLGLRYASVVTRDGHEHLIPNELLMTEKVVNWSYSTKTVRIRRSVGVAYGTDVRKAMALVIAAAAAAPRTLADPPPRCLLIGFGDNSVDLEVRFWIEDPQSGVTSAANDVLLNIWDAFNEHGVQFPFPQRDVHLKTAGPVDVRLTREGTDDD